MMMMKLLSALLPFHAQLENCFLLESNLKKGNRYKTPPKVTGSTGARPSRLPAVS